MKIDLIMRLHSSDQGWIQVTKILPNSARINLSASTQLFKDGKK